MQAQDAANARRNENAIMYREVILVVTSCWTAENGKEAGRQQKVESSVGGAKVASPQSGESKAVVEENISCQAEGSNGPWLSKNADM